MKKLITKSQLMLLFSISLIALSLSFYFIGLNFLIFIAYIPFFFFIINTKIKGYHIFLFFLIFFGTTLFFINKLSIEVRSSFLGYFSLILLCSTFYYLIFSIFKKGIIKFLNIDDAPLVFILSILLAEILSEAAPLGFPWILNALPVAIYPFFISTASLFGVFFISAEVLFINYFLYKIIRNVITLYHKKNLKISIKTKHAPHLYRYLFIIILIFVFSLLWYYFNPYDKNVIHTDLDVTVAQPNIPLNYRFRYEFISDMIDKIMSESPKASQNNTSLIVWPESAIPEYVKYNQNLLNSLKRAAKSNNIGILFGTPDFEIKNTIRNSFNSIYMADTQGELQIYRKYKLVAFGEFIPFTNIFPFLRELIPEVGVFQTPGYDNKLFYLNAKNLYTFYPTVCFEGIFQSYIRSLMKEKPIFLVNVTNDSYYDNTYEHKQHLYLNVFRAVETKRMIFRSATTGISAIIDIDGSIIKQIPSNTEGYINHKVSYYDGKTIFVLFGWLWTEVYQVIGLLVLFTAILTIIFPRFRLKYIIPRIRKKHI